MNEYIHSYITNTAFDYAGVTPEEVLDINMHQDGTLFEVDFSTEWMHYICYVDLSGAVPGFFSEPVPEHETDGLEQSFHERYDSCA